MPFSLGSRMAPHGLLNFKMIGARKGEAQVLVERNEQVAHRSAAFAYPTTFRRGEGAFYGVVRDVAVGHFGVKEDEEVAVAVVLQVTQANAEDVAADGVVNGHVESDMVILIPFRFGDDGAHV